MFNLKKCLIFITVLQIFHVFCAVLNTTNLPVIVTLNSTELGPEFVPVNNGEAKVDDNINPPIVPDFEEIQTTDSPQHDGSKIVEDAKFWYDNALKQLAKTIKTAQKNKENGYRRKAKNIIIFVGDGMGLTTITAGRIYKGQYLKHGNGEEEKLSFDEFPYTGLAKTYNVDKQVPDSAGTATALFCGAKSEYGAVGMDATRSKFNGKQGRLTSIMDWAQAENKRTGIVTTTRITHATPAATYARIFFRDWECDTKIPQESYSEFTDIARQLVENSPGNKFNVIMGGGLSPMGATNPHETSKIDWQDDQVCKRGDNMNLTQKWLEDGSNLGDKRAFVKNLKELKAVNFANVDRLMGLFRNNHITYALGKEEGEPSLKEMTEAAIKVLERKNSNGYVLMVEGGRIDHAHHQNYAHAALHEVLEFDMAIEAALKNTNEEETLILVTADHSHSVTLNGYPKRGADILGTASRPTDPMAYETIMYANGPGFYEHLGNNTSMLPEPMNIWLSLSQISATRRQSPTYRHMAAVPLKTESHGGEDVIVFANGPGSSLVRGVFEQNYLAFVMSYAGCMGPAKKFDKTCNNVRSGAKVTTTVSIFLLLTICILHFVNKN